MSFSLGELNCPSLEYVYDMTWAEFRIRQFAYRRMDNYSWIKVREIAYQALVGSHADPKRLPKSKEKFMPLDDRKQKELTERQLEAMRNAQAVYLKEIQKRNGKQ